MDYFDYAVNVVLDNEGDQFVDDPQDNGHATKYGLTLRFLQGINPNWTVDQLRNLTREEAVKIYHDDFWTDYLFPYVNSMRVVTSLFDASVNSGVGEAVKMAQRACNSLSGASVIDVDGRFGKLTLRAINNCDATLLLKAFRDQRKMFYMDLVRQHPKDEKFLNGWLKRSQT